MVQAMESVVKRRAITYGSGYLRLPILDIYANNVNTKWALTSEFVESYFSRYVNMGYTHPNVMMDLRQIASHDRGYDAGDKQYFNWHMYPTTPYKPCTPAFRFWADRPKKLVVLAFGCCTNIFEMLYVAGGRWRFMARFNHAVNAYTKAWFQVDETWLQKYMKPQVIHDMYFKVLPLQRVPVSKTGKASARDKLLKCVKQVQVQLVVHWSLYMFFTLYRCSVSSNGLPGRSADDSGRRSYGC